MWLKRPLSSVKARFKGHFLCVLAQGVGGKVGNLIHKKEGAKSAKTRIGRTNGRTNGQTKARSKNAKNRGLLSKKSKFRPLYCSFRAII